MAGRCRLSSIKATAGKVLHCDQHDAHTKAATGCRLSSTTANDRAWVSGKACKAWIEVRGQCPDHPPGRGLFEEGVKNAELFRARYWVQQRNCCVW
jgi:hypothetical protein